MDELKPRLERTLKVRFRLKWERKFSHKSQTARFMRKISENSAPFNEFDWGWTPLGKYRAEKRERARFRERKRELALP